MAQYSRVGWGKTTTINRKQL